MSPGVASLFRDALGDAPPTLFDEFVGHFRARRLERREHLVHAGENAQVVGFVTTGLLRIYYTRGDGREFVKSFVAEGSFVGALDSLLGNDESRVAIEALEPTELWVAPFETIAAFYERDMAFQRFGRLHAERLLLRKMRREESLLLDSAEERYSAFLRDQPDLARRVPGYHLASYLGITPEALSRVRGALGPRATRGSSGT